MKKLVFAVTLLLTGCYRPIPAPVLLDANDVCKHFDGLAQVEVTDDRSFWSKDKQPNQLLKVVYWYTATCNDTTVVSRRVEIHS